MSDNQADLIVHARWIAPVAQDKAPSAEVLENHALVVRDGQIVDLLPSALANEKWQAATVTRLDSHLLIPGLINAHTHAAMNLLRGIADDLPLMTWLEKHIWPAEGRFVSEQFVFDGTRLAAAEMIRSGTTCFADQYFFPASAARATVEAGLRASLFCPILDFPTPMGAGPDDYLRLATEAADNWRHEPRVTIGFGPHAPYTVSDGPLEKVLTLAEELALCERYIRIEQLRLGERLGVEWRIELEPESVALPLLTLQPLLENAIYHGIQPLTGGGVVRIAAAIEQGRVVLRVGNPKQEGASEHQGNRMALDNIRHRLEALHGPSVSVSARSQQQHYEIEISYPLQ